MTDSDAGNGFLWSALNSSAAALKAFNPDITQEPSAVNKLVGSWYLSPEQHIVEFLVHNAFLVPATYYFWTRHTWSTHRARKTAADRSKYATMDKIIFASLTFAFVAQVLYKGTNGRLPFMFQPCHAMTLLFVLLVAGAFDRKVPISTDGSGGVDGRGASDSTEAAMWPASAAASPSASASASASSGSLSSPLSRSQLRRAADTQEYTVDTDLTDRWFNIYLHGMYCPFIPIFIPDVRDLTLPLEVPIFFIHHVLLVVAPFYYIYTGRFTLLKPNYYVGWIMMYVYHLDVLTPVGIFLGANLNYMMHPPHGVGLEAAGRFYRFVVAWTCLVFAYIMRRGLIDYGCKALGIKGELRGPGTVEAHGGGYGRLTAGRARIAYKAKDSNFSTTTGPRDSELGTAESDVSSRDSADRDTWGSAGGTGATSTARGRGRGRTRPGGRGGVRSTELSGEPTQPTPVDAHDASQQSVYRPLKSKNSDHFSVTDSDTGRDDGMLSDEDRAALGGQ